MNNDLSELFAEIDGEAKPADRPGTALLLRGARSAAAVMNASLFPVLPAMSTFAMSQPLIAV